MTGKTPDFQSGKSRSNRDCRITFRIIDSEATRRAYRNIINFYHNYKDWSDYPGRRLCYLIYADGDCIGAIGVASSPLNIGARDKFIGWTVEQKMFNINKMATNYRYCLMEKGWSSKVLKAFLPFIRKEWEKYYGDTLVLLETMIQPPFTGICYKANGWIFVGKTKGTAVKRPPSKGLLSHTLDGSEGESHQKRAELLISKGWKEASKINPMFEYTVSDTEPKFIYVKPLHRYWKKELLKMSGTL